MKIILIPDSFKGTMSSNEICEIMAEAVEAILPDAQVLRVPVADGGEGSVNAFLSSVGGTQHSLSVSGPFFDEIDSFYGILADEETAVIEMAAAAGLPLAGEKKNPLITTTYGVGQLIGNALGHGCKQIIMGLGGSATNDAGCGAAAALGVCFYDVNGESFVPVGGTLQNIARIDAGNIDARIAQTKFITMCDIDNPVYGKNGAAHVFAPQKGATDDDVLLLDAGLKHLCGIIKRDLNIDAPSLPGAGAAGAMGYGMVAFFNSELRMGIETVLDTVGFDDMLKDTNYVFSGEGRIDVQSMHGKVAIGVARRAQRQNVPVIAVVGDIAEGIEDAYSMGVSAIFSINRVAIARGEAKKRARDDMRKTMENILRLIRAKEHRQ